MSDMTAKVSTWLGLNRMPFISDGEMRNMKNLSSDGFPYLTTRKGRKLYKFQINIPATPGNGYVADVTELPTDLTEEDQGKIYKLVGEFEAGSFYKYDGEKWVKDKSVTVTSEVIEVTDGKTLISKECALKIHSNTNTSKKGMYDDAEKYKGSIAKYIGETKEGFERNKIYVYDIAEWFEWKESDTSAGLDGTKDKLPDASEQYLGKKYKVDGKYYTCYVFWKGHWTETQIYPATDQTPSEPAEGQSMFWCGASALTKGNYYVSTEDSGIYYYAPTKASENALEKNLLPKASAENEGTVYLYTGASSGGFMQWTISGNDLAWVEVGEPQVYKSVTISEYIKSLGYEINEITEICPYGNQLAAIVKSDLKGYQLYYDQKLWDISSLAEEGGKRLVPLGSRLVVGESGNYLHFKENKEDGKTTSKELVFEKTGAEFSAEIKAFDFGWGNGDEKTKEWKAFGKKDGESVFVIYAKEGKGILLKQIADGLVKSGAGFSVYSKRKGIAHKQFLNAQSVKFEESKLIGGWTSGTIWYEDYADVLEIRATGAWEDFDWYSEAGDTLVFESTDPHYYDVVAWKKRLWGYYDNVLTGTAADIFDAEGRIDWTRGDNTNSEAITQPLWQGGSITGVAALMNALVYFKEDCITIVQGNYPAIMSSSTISCKGLPPENRKSVAVANDSAYYLSTDGVYRFDGGIPRCISRDAKIKGTNAVGASDGNKYWLSLKEDSGEYSLYVYDIVRDIWHKEDNTHVTSFAVFNGQMHMAVGTEVYNITSPQEDVKWECELWFDEGTAKSKKYKQITVRGNVGKYCELYLKADDGEWELIHSCEGKLDVKIPSIDAEELSLKLKGEGICEIKSLSRVYEVR